MKIQLKNKHTGAVEETPIGYSWTCLLFGGFVPIIRGDWGSLFKLVGLTIITLGIYHFVFAATYNKQYLKNMIMKGFTPANEQAEMHLQVNGLYMPQKVTNQTT